MPPLLMYLEIKPLKLKTRFLEVEIKLFELENKGLWGV